MSTENKPTKVLYCESNADGTIGGSHYCLAYLVENIDRKQFEPTVVFYDDHALVPRFRAAAETLIFPQDTPVRWFEGAQGALATLLVPIRRAVNFTKFLQSVLHHARFLRREQFELLHLNNSVTRHQNWMAAAFLAGVPCIVHERGLSDSYGFLDKAYARGVALIIPMSEWIKDHMVARGVSPRKIRVMYDGLDPSRLTVNRTPESIRGELGIAPGRPVIGIVGNVRPWKGQETVVRAMIEVTKQRRDVVCLFVGAATAGDKPFEAKLRALIAEAGIEDNVRFTGYQQEVPSFINLMQFVIHASVEPEPFGMVVLEAMAQHKAVIGSRAGGPVEMVVEGETGYTFPPGDAPALAARVLELLADPAKAQAMGQRGYDRLISAFTLQRYIGGIHATYRAILRSDPVPSQVDLANHSSAL